MRVLLQVISLVLTGLALIEEGTATKVQRKYGCVVPKEPLYGTIKFYNRARAIVIVCDPGYMHIGSKKRVCRRGRWDGYAFECITPPKERNRCPVLEKPENGDVFLSGREVGDVASFKCSSGSTLVGARSRTCQAGRKWDGEPTVCKSMSSMQDIARELEDNFIYKHATHTATAGSKFGGGGKLAPGKKGLDIVLVLDTSASISPRGLDTAKKFMKLIVNAFGVQKDATGGNGTRVALITFAGTADIVFNLDDADMRSVDAVCKKIDEITTTGGGTNFLKALSKVYKDIWLKIKKGTAKAKHATRGVFFITDSEETASSSTPMEIRRRAGLLKEKGFEIFAIGVGRTIDYVALQDIASPPFVEHVFPIHKFEDLDEIADIIAEKNIDYGQCGISGNYKPGSAVNVRPNSWPWIGWVSVNDNRSPKTCGGALVCQRYFVTAAHCLQKVTRKGRTVDVKPERVIVYLGDHDLYRTDGTEAMAKVRRFHKHPNYTGEVNEHGVREYDVAVLDFGKLPRNQPTLNKQMRPICVGTNISDDGVYDYAETLLNSRKVSERDEGYVAGWGHSPMNMYDIDSFPRGVLAQTKRRAQSNRRCGKMYPGIDTDMFFCVGESEERETCKGDIGGPYMDLLPNKQFGLLGLALETRGCSIRNGKFSIFLNMLQEDVVTFIGEKIGECNRMARVKVKSDDDEESRDQDEKSDEKIDAKRNNNGRIRFKGRN